MLLVYLHTTYNRLHTGLHAKSRTKDLLALGTQANVIQKIIEMMPSIVVGCDHP